MDKINKALKKLNKKEKITIKEILINIENENTKNLDIKKLKSRDDIFRVRKGRIRIIFHKKKENISILSIEKRTDQTYKDL